MDKRFNAEELKKVSQEHCQSFNSTSAPWSHFIHAPEPSFEPRPVIRITPDDQSQFNFVGCKASGTHIIRLDVVWWFMCSTVLHELGACARDAPSSPTAAAPVRPAVERAQHEYEYLTFPATHFLSYEYPYHLHPAAFQSHSGIMEYSINKNGQPNRRPDNFTATDVDIEHTFRPDTHHQLPSTAAALPWCTYWHKESPTRTLSRPGSRAPLRQKLALRPCSAWV